MNYLRKILISLIITIVLINALSYLFNLYNDFNAVTFSETIKETVSESIVENNDDDINVDSNEKVFNTNVGEFISFGRFYDLTDKDTIERMPIIWKVIDKVDGYSLLISKDIIKSMPYNTFWIPTNWKESNIRFWLNYDFYDLAFSDDEKKLIKQVELENIGNYFYNVSCDYKTTDKVFLLSIEEVRKYNTHNNDYVAVGTKYARHNGLWISKYATSNGNSVWWLRSPGKTTSSAAIIHADGTLGLGGDGVATHGNGVRPCIWIKTD